MLRNVYVAVRDQSITDLRTLLHIGMYRDTPMEDGLKGILSIKMGEIIMDIVNDPTSDLHPDYREAVFTLMARIFERVQMLEIKDVRVLYDDTIIFEC